MDTADRTEENVWEHGAVDGPAVVSANRALFRQRKELAIFAAVLIAAVWTFVSWCKQADRGTDKAELPVSGPSLMR